MAAVVWVVFALVIVAQAPALLLLRRALGQPSVELRVPVGRAAVGWPRLPWLAGLLATAALALYIAMAEVSRLAGDVTDPAGRSWEFNNVMGPSTLLSTDTAGWDFLLGAGHDRTVTVLLWFHLALDTVFIGVYGCILWRVTGGHILLRCASGALVVLDLFEDAVAAFENLTAHTVSGSPLPSGAPTSPPWATPSILPTLSQLKWWAVALLTVGAVLVLLRPDGSRARAALGRARHALWVQRFSLVALLPIALLGLFPGPNLLDQLPDVQRRWVGDSRGSQHALMAAVVIAVYFLVLFVFGRLRADHAYRAYLAPDPPPPGSESPSAALAVWLVGPVVIGGLAVVSLLGGGPVSLGRLLVFCGASVAVALLSLVLRWASTSWWPGLASLLEPLPPRAARGERLSAVVTAGDVLACAVVVVGGLGLVRSFTAPVALAAGSGVRQSAADTALLAAGVVTALGIWLPVALLSARVNITAPTPVPGFAAFAELARPGYGPATPNLTRRWVFLLASLFAYLAIGLWPVWLAGVAGVIAVVVGSLATLSVLIGSIVVFEQGRPPPELLRLLRLFRTTPVVSVLLLVILWSSATGDDADVHGIRGRGPEAGTVQRPTLDRALDTWLGQTRVCTHAASVNGQPVLLRPMLLVGAEGGGIRAAYWTAATMERIASPTGWQGGQESAAGCSAAATFLSSGASGGAVGLTVGRFSAQPAKQVLRLAEPDALGAATDGLFVRDLLFSATGLPLPVLGSDDLFAGDARSSWGRWEDRAGLIELVWQRQSTSLGTQFLRPDPASAGLVGELALNSTAAATGCRMLVSTVALDQRSPDLKPGATERDVAAEAPAAATCDAADAPAPYSVDTLAAYGPGAAPSGVARNPPEEGKPVTGCAATMSAATAAMLASRFPYVTPSGLIGRCGPTPQQQLIDGGYTENSGLGTLADLSSHWLTRISDRNAATLRGLGQPGAQAQQPPQIIVPVLVYLDNGTGSDVSTPTRKNTNEILIPSQGRKAGSAAQSDAPAQLQRLAAMVEAHQSLAPDGRTTTGAAWCPASEAGCDVVADLVGRWAPRRVVVVHQRTEPAVTAPLGWVLSRSSIETMDRALTEQETSTCRAGLTANDGRPTPSLTGDAVCKRGYGSLYDLISLLRDP